MLRLFWLLGLAAVSFGVDSSSLAQERGVVKTFRGIVLDEQGKAVPGAEAMLSFRMRAEEKIVQSDAEGKFSLEVRLNGSAPMVVARTKDGARQGVLSLPYEEKDWKEEEARIVLKPARKLTAKVVGASSGAVEHAKACLLLSYDKYRPLKSVVKTDAQGIATWLVPDGYEGGGIFAVQPGEGIAIARLVKETSPANAISEPIRLKLEGVRSITIKAVDEDDHPLAGVKVGPSQLSIPGIVAGQYRGANLSFFWDEFSVNTKEDGTATFDYLPKTAGNLSFSAQFKNHDASSLNIDLAMTNPETTLRLRKLIAVSGKVLLPDGKPAAGATVQFVGDGYEEHSGYRNTMTDLEGKFSFQVPPDLLCMIGARMEKEKLFAMPVDWIVTARNKPVDGIVLHLEPARRIFGQVTFGQDKKPDAGQTIAVRLEGRQIYEIPGVSLPNPRKSNKGVMRSFSEYTKTNEQGEFEVYTSAFQHTVVLQSGQNLHEKVDLSNDAEKEVNFHRERPSTIPFTAKVTLKDTGKGTAGAHIYFAYEDQKAQTWTEAKSGADGTLKVDRSPYPAKVFAISADGKYAELKSVSESDASLQFSLRPTATLKGRVVDKATGEPLVDKEITYGIRVEQPDRGTVMYSDRFGNRLRTDKDGNFETGPVATNAQYRVTIEMDNSGRSYTLSTITPTKEGKIDLGDLKIERPE